jgi:hypothetical protein
VCVNGYKKKKVKFDQERNKSFAVQSVRISSEGRITSTWSIRSYPVGTKHGANIITAIVTIFGERTFWGTLENVNRHCNYL